MQFNIDEKEMQIRKFNELVEQSEGALNKMVKNSQRLSEALNSALDDKF